MKPVENDESDVPPAEGEEGGDTSDPLKAARRCPEKIGRGRLREYLIRLRNEVTSIEDLQLGEHAASCSLCSEVIEDLYASGEVPQDKVDFESLVPLLTVEAVESRPARSADHDPDIERVSKKFAGRIASVKTWPPSLKDKIREIDEDYRNKPSEFKKQTLEWIEGLPPAQREALQERVIATVGSLVSGHKPEHLTINTEEDCETLMGFAALPTEGRAWRLKPDSPIAIIEV